MDDPSIQTYQIIGGTIYQRLSVFAENFHMETGDTNLFELLYRGSVNKWEKYCVKNNGVVLIRFDIANVMLCALQNIVKTGNKKVTLEDFLTDIEKQYEKFRRANLDWK